MPSNGSVHYTPGPGEPGYISFEEFTQLELLRRAEYEQRPDLVAKRAADAEAQACIEAEKNAKRRRPRLIQTTDYPWLKPNWVEPPVRPFKRP